MNWAAVKNLLSKFSLASLKLGFFGFLFFGLFVPPVAAEENFTIDLRTDYSVTSAGETTVTHNFTIINKTPSFFINRYSILVSSIKPKAISAKMGDVPIEPTISEQGNQTTVTVDFPEKVVGENKALKFEIKYTTSDLAQVSGKVLEVNIPPMAKTDNFRNFSVSVATPSNFGLPTRSNPMYVNSTNQNGLQAVEYNQAAGKGIVSVYGSNQFFKLKFNYQMSNPGNQPVLTQVTFPPDTSTQKIYYDQIQPRPESWKTDLDGNWLATYTLPANKDVLIEVAATIRLSLVPDLSFPTQPVLPEFLKSQDYWPVTDIAVQEQAEPLTSPNQIYDFTLEKLSYTTANLDENLTRLGALKILKTPDLATCQEYADLFVTLARANKIPARRLIGYAQTKNQQLRPTGFQGDILHAWAEYYDSEKNQWQVVDPTWGDTTGGMDYFSQTDLNHIVFAINGISSVLPYPAGSYQQGKTPSKSVVVEFADSFPESKPELYVEVAPKKIAGLAIPGWLELTVTNPVGQAWYNLNFAFPEGLAVTSEIPLPDRILPYQVYKTTISAYNQNKPNYFGQTNFEFALNLVKLNVGGAQTTLYVIPKLASQLGFSNFVLALVGGVSCCAILAWGLFVLGLNWANSLRRQSQESSTPASKLQPIPPTQPQDQETSRDSSGS